MKKALICLLVALNLFALCPKAEELEITSEAAILIDAETGQILYEKNKDEKLYPASITKIMTIYLAALQNTPDQVITASETAIRAVPNDTSNIALDYGEQITMEQAMYAAMLMSANDACNVLAEGVSGSIEAFTDLMNQTAREFGALNTNFANANGLIDENHYTTAYDFAAITRNAIQNPEFFRIFTSMEYSIPPTNKKSVSRNFYAQHRMMHQSQYAQYGVVGGKAGYTQESQHTLVTYGEKNGFQLIAVTLKNPAFNAIYQDTQKLLDFGYEQFERVEISASEIQPKVEGLTTWTPSGSVRCLLRKGETAAQVIAEYSDDAVALYSPRFEYLGSMPVEKVTTTPVWKTVMKTIGIVLVVLVVLILVLYMIIIIRSHQKRKRRRKSR